MPTVHNEICILLILMARHGGFLWHRGINRYCWSL